MHSAIEKITIFTENPAHFIIDSIGNMKVSTYLK